MPHYTSLVQAHSVTLVGKQRIQDFAHFIAVLLRKIIFRRPVRNRVPNGSRTVNIERRMQTKRAQPTMPERSQI